MIKRKERLAMNYEFIIDLTGAENRRELHERIAQNLPVPEWYGRNLDALYDILTEPFFGNGCLICFTGCAGFKESMPRYFKALQQMCMAACEENSGLTIEFAE